MIYRNITAFQISNEIRAHETEKKNKIKITDMNMLIEREYSRWNSLQDKSQPNSK